HSAKRLANLAIAPALVLVGTLKIPNRLAVALTAFPQLAVLLLEAPNVVQGSIALPRDSLERFLELLPRVVVGVAIQLGDAGAEGGVVLLARPALRRLLLRFLFAPLVEPDLAL